MDSVASNVPQFLCAFSREIGMVERAREFSLKPGIPEARPGTQHPKLKNSFLNIDTRFPIKFGLFSVNYTFGIREKEKPPVLVEQGNTTEDFSIIQDALAKAAMEENTANGGGEN